MEFISFFTCFLTSFFVLLVHLIFKQTTKSIDDIEKFRKFLNYFVLYFIGFVISCFLSFLEWHLEVSSFLDGCILGSIIWIGCIVPIQLYSYIYKQITLYQFFMILMQWFLIFSIIGGLLAE